MWQKIRCIRFGEVLLDENKQPLLLCSNCNTDYRELQTFRQHLDSCNGLEHLVQQNKTIAFMSDKGRRIMGKIADTVKEYLIYEPNEVIKVDTSNAKADSLELDLIKIEEELLDPRWYSDLTVSPEPQYKFMAYKDLVEAVTPYVQFKENVKSNTHHTTDSKLASTTLPNSKANAKNHVVTLHANLKQPQQLNEKRATLRSSRNEANKTAANALLQKKIATRKQDESQAVATNSAFRKTLTNNRRQLPMVQLPMQLSNELQAKTHKLTVESAKLTNRRSFTSKTLPISPPAIAKQTHLPSPAAITKRHQTIAISMDNAMIEPEFKSQFVAHNKKSVKTSPAKVLQSIAASRKQQAYATSNAKAAQTLQQQSCVQPANTPAKAKQTEQILSKLQTLGLQVKRTQPAQKPTSQSTASKTDDKTMELLKKLQSKGMKVQIINKNTNLGVIAKPKMPTQSRTPAPHQTTTTQQQKAIVNRNLIIKKLK